MCDTLCALPDCTENGTVLFAKNSDRSPNEPHVVIHIPEKRYSAQSAVKLTYITIPQAEYTYEVILCKPSWIWGAEMGMNAASVAIGNEAVFTKSRRGNDALTGMDLVRLALERCESAVKAVELITALLEKYGQGGNCGFDRSFYYDNSFLMVDPNEGYVLETSGKRWVTKKVEGFHAISNRLTLHKDHLMRGGVEAGYDFAGKLTEPLYTHFSGSKHRLSSSYCSFELPMDVKKMMAALRRHAPEDTHALFTRGSVKSVCMHAGGIVGDHTTGSLVIEIRKDRPSTLWITGASTPCISAFKPVFFGTPSGAPVFSDENESKAYWLKREHVHRSILSGQTDCEVLRRQRDAVEEKWIQREKQLFYNGMPSAHDLQCFAMEANLEEERWISAFTPDSLSQMPAKGRFNRYWQRKNELLGL